jgi:hypothetical protein
MSYFSKRALRWAAPVALVGALGLAACGSSDDTEAVRVAAPSAVGLGSDQHLTNQAEELARASAGAGRDHHQYNTAAEKARPPRANEAASDRLTAQAEQYERSVEAGNRAAQMAQAESYVQQQQDRAAGSQAVQMTKTPAYVRWLQDWAEANSSGNGGSGDEFVPGSRHMPTR